jgi:Mn-dependent DtxR family transcriptional regulator
MFEVTGYEYPNVFVRCRRTAETYLFEIGSDGALTHKEACHDHNAARRAAMAFLDRLRATTQTAA